MRLIKSVISVKIVLDQLVTKVNSMDGKIHGTTGRFNSSKYDTDKQNVAKNMERC